ncbi:MAG: hypothetical protein EZS28_034171 [Streblomastix strix]|uniref:Uncharacterized protein n=1 Tax=Streblomastix strix TaxID=222440 RepID=A0A5J4UK19_9EUKA|nr:MAG: hypothetical protein EZS28_034171 [Streblomastix strix]
MDLAKKRSSTFIADGRSQIGRRMILANMLHHVDNVQQMPHEVDARLNRVVMYPKKKTINDDFVEVREAARRSNLVKPYVNSGKPATYDMRDRISRFQSVNRKDKFNSVEHYNRVHHMQRRIIENYSLVERKKNKNDAMVYPVLEKRNVNDKATEDPTQVLEILQKRNSIQPSGIKNSTQFHRTGIYFTHNPYQRPHTSQSMGRTGYSMSMRDTPQSRKQREKMTKTITNTNKRTEAEVKAKVNLDQINNIWNQIHINKEKEKEKEMNKGRFRNTLMEEEWLEI